MARTPHFKVPLTLGVSGFEQVEQDSVEDIDQCVEAVLRTPEGTRIDSPGFGRPDPTFEQVGGHLNAEAYVVAVEEWEPRASVIGDAQIEEMTERIVIDEGAS